MQPISFPEANANLAKPSSMTDDQCGSLPVYQGVDHEGLPIFISCFKLDEKEMLKILETGKVWLRIYGQSHPPVSLDVSNPWSE
jgi:hypothetical protein